MLPERPKWLRDDGTDERLVNPTASMVDSFSHTSKIVSRSYNGKASTIGTEHPEFIQSLLEITNKIKGFDIVGRVSSGNLLSPAEETEFEKLAKTRLELVQKFVTDTYGSVEALMDWWEN